MNPLSSSGLGVTPPLPAVVFQVTEFNRYVVKNVAAGSGAITLLFYT